MASLSPRELIQHVRSTAGQAGLENRPAIALAIGMAPGSSPDDPGAWYSPSMTVSPVVHPVLEALMELQGATRRGRATWQVGFGEDTPKGAVPTILDATKRGTVWWKSDLVTQRKPRDLTGQRTVNAHDYYWTQRANEARPVAAYFTAERIARHCGGNQYGSDQGRERLGAGQFGVVALSTDQRSLFISMHTTQFLELPEPLRLEIGAVPLNTWQVGRGFGDPVTVYPAQALAIAEWARTQGLLVVDPSNTGGLQKFKAVAEQSVIAWPRPGRPAQATVSIGVRAPAGARAAVGGGQLIPAGRTLAVRQEDSVALAAALEHMPDGTRLIHPAVLDTARMAAAEPVNDPRLRDFQRKAVGLHLATTCGYVNASSPGLGKTVMTLVAMARKAAHTCGYRGLVVAEANVRAQWCVEAARWFPSACVVRVESRTDAENLAQTLKDAGSFPVLVVTSYALASDVADDLTAEDPDTGFEPEVDSLEEAPAEPLAPVVPLRPTTPPKPVDDRQMDLLDMLAEILEQDPEVAEDPVVHAAKVALAQALLAVRWDDIVADEAVVLGTTSSKQSKALWRLRENAEVAVALTGTPISTSVNNLGALVAWARGDRRMFHGLSLEGQFDLSDDDQLRDFTDALGAIVFRRDKSEIDDEIPGVESQVMVLEPSPAEKALANAARNELKRAYDELLTWLGVVAAEHPDSEEYAAARAALAEARHAWLGGTTLARMAASDPAALTTANGAGAALLASQGLVAAATAQTGTKRLAVVTDAVDRVGRGERLLIFTEFATVARGLIADLDAAGLRVGEVLGGGGKRRDRFIEAFQRGELDVLVATSAGERGLNLQTATTLIHYDLPWTPQGIIQRMGRVERIGATADLIKVVFPVMAGTIEERVASVVVARAATMMRALDVARGVDARQTDTGRALGTLAATAKDEEVSHKEAALLQITRELLAA